MINNYKNPTYVLHRKIDDEKEIIKVALDEINKKSYNNSGD